MTSLVFGVAKVVTLFGKTSPGCVVIVAWICLLLVLFGGLCSHWANPSLPASTNTYFASSFSYSQMKVVWRREMCPSLSLVSIKLPRSPVAHPLSVCTTGVADICILCSITPVTSLAASVRFLSQEWLSVNGVSFLSIHKFLDNKLSLFCLLVSWKILFCLKTIVFVEWCLWKRRVAQTVLEGSFSSAICLRRREVVVSVLGSYKD